MIHPSSRYKIWWTLRSHQKSNNSYRMSSQKITSPNPQPWYLIQKRISTRQTQMVKDKSLKKVSDLKFTAQKKTRWITKWMMTAKTSHEWSPRRCWQPKVVRSGNRKISWKSDKQHRGWKKMVQVLKLDLPIQNYSRYLLTHPSDTRKSNRKMKSCLTLTNFSIKKTEQKLKSLLNQKYRVVFWKKQFWVPSN